MIRRSLLVLGLAGLSAAIACSGDTATGIAGVCDVSDPVSSIIVSPGSALLHFRSPPRQSDSLQLADTALNRFGAPRTDVTFKFGSSDTGVVVVTNSGLVRARGVGTASVTVSTCDKTSKVNVTVVSDVAGVVVAPALDTLVAGDSLLLSALALTSGGSPLSGVIFSWTSSATQVVTVAAQGDSIAMARTLAAGNASIQATGQGASAAAQLIVLPRVFLTSTAPGATTIAAGLELTCGVISQGRGYCWGIDDLGQLGAVADSLCFEKTNVLPTGDKPCSLDPLRFGPDLSFTAVSAGDSSACGITSDGRAYCWGSNNEGQLGNGEVSAGAPPHLVTGALRFSTVSVGGFHACGLTTDGAAYCWGQDKYGELGDGRVENSTTPIPVIVDQIAGAPVSFKVISADSTHSCGVSTSGDAYCWGLNSHGELGSTAATETCASVLVCSTAPLKVNAPPGVQFATISAGADHSCAISTTGAAYCWGANDLGQLGNGTTGVGGPSPVLVAGGHTFAEITSGSRFTCALTQAGAAWCWGDNSNLTLGIGPFSGSGSVSSSPVAVSGGLSFARLSAGNSHVCGISLTGAAYCWGSNLYGALGNTLQAAFRGIPQQVATPQ